MKRGLVLEGGAMRGLYTAGVLDVFLDNGLEFDGIVGVSAGAIFGVNFVSKQKGRVLRYSKKYNSDRNYMGIIPWIKTGNLIDTEYAYERVPRKLDVFDDETFKKSDTVFYAVLTNINTGKPEYHVIKSAFDQMDEIRASGSMPFFARPVEIDNKLYLDGAVTDSIPYDFMLEKGYDELIVVLTRQKDYVKEPISKTLTNIKYKKKYPNLSYRMLDRHNMYNNQIKRLEELEEKKIIKVIRPSEKPDVKRTEKDPEKLEKLYNLGVKDAKDFLRENI
ncbi:MAG: patatin family protein [Tissierellia bacterium]|nr:patatin family protein [Tissierellia bacterium]